MIVCPKCQTDNQVGAIFCRGCHEKLNLEDLNPEDIQKGAVAQTRDKSKWSVFSIIRNSVMLVILLFLIWILYSIFGVPELPQHAELDEKAAKSIEKYRDYLNRGSRTRTLTIDEFAHLARLELSVTKEQREKIMAERIEQGDTAKGLEAYNIWFDVVQAGEDNIVRIICLYEHPDWSWMSFHNTLVGSVYMNDKKEIDFDVREYHLGTLNVTGFGMAEEHVQNRFRTLLRNKQPFWDLQRRVKDFEISEDNKDGKTIKFRFRSPNNKK